MSVSTHRRHFSSPAAPTSGEQLTTNPPGLLLSRVRALRRFDECAAPLRGRRVAQPSGPPRPRSDSCPFSLPQILRPSASPSSPTYQEVQLCNVVRPPRPSCRVERATRSAPPARNRLSNILPVSPQYSDPATCRWGQFHPPDSPPGSVAKT